MWRLHLVWLWLLVFAVTLSGHSWLWRVDTFTDDEVWKQRVMTLQSDLQNPEDFDQEHYSEHPGMPVLLVAQGLVAKGMLVGPALGGVVALLTAIAVASSAVLMRSLRPQSWWWLAGIGMLVFHPFLIHASPVDVVVAYWLVMIMLFLWWGYPDHYEEWWWLIVLGVMAGVALATRLHVASIMLFLLGTMLVGGRRRFWVMAGGGAIVWSIALNPLVWHIPLDFGRAMVSQLGFFTGAALATGGGPRQLSGMDFWLFAPFSLLAIGAVVVGWWWPEARVSIPARVRNGLFGMTAITSVLLLTASLQSRRYFFPLALVWEIIWPLVVLEWWGHVQVKHRQEAMIRRIGMAFIVCLLVSANAYLLAVSIS